MVIKYATHKHKTANDEAAARILEGNISEIKTQVTGASVAANTPMAMSRKTETMADFIARK